MVEQQDPDPIVQEVLGTIYKPERILAQQVIELGPQQTTVSFVFPRYDRTASELDHVSVVQMQEAILEGIACAIGLEAKNGRLPIVDYTELCTGKLNPLIVRQNISFRRMVKANEVAELTFRVNPTGVKHLKKQYHSVTVLISGFLVGEVECLLEM